MAHRACAPDAAAAVVVGASELAYRHVLRALAARRRYRYVRPEVRRAESGLVVVSPCCSRNVDPDGGVIEIAWLERLDRGWRLHHRDRVAKVWVKSVEGTLAEVLDLLRLDPERVFWP